MTDQEPMNFSSPEEMVRKGAELLTSEDVADMEKARRIFEYLLQNMGRNNAGLVFSMAVTFMREGRTGLAEVLYRAALTMDGDKDAFSAVHNNLGFILNTEGRYDEALEEFHAALAIDDTQPEFYNNIATAYVNTGQSETCIEWADKALERDPESRDAKWNRGLALLELGRWAEGWKGYNAGLTQSFNSSQQRKRRYEEEPIDLPYWDVGKGIGQNVVVYGEQGVGDEIMASSVFPDAVTDMNIIYEAHPRLVSIMRHSFGDQFPIYGTRKTPWRTVAFHEWHKIEAKAPIFNLCQHYRQDDKDFPRVPYLKPFDNLVDKYKTSLAKLGSRPKIGVSWKGGSTITRNDLRSIPVVLWEELFKSVDVDWVSLQYDPADKMGWNTLIAEEFEKNTGVDLNHDIEVVNDLDECYGGLIHALDLVISVNTSLVHACGAFGVPCWTLTPSRPAWRYQVPGANSLGDDKMIWYGDHIRQIRQDADNWDHVLQEVQDELIDLYGRRSKVAA